MPIDVDIDFETRSTVDLRKCGVYPYAEHSTTDLWCMAWAVEDEEPSLWFPGQMFPPRLRTLIEDGAGLWAHNAMFERVIWRAIGVPRYGFPEVELERWHCTAAEAAAMALPRALFACAQVLGLEVQKDDEGYRLMMRMCRPRSTKGGKIVWWNIPERIKRLGEYCQQDVRVEQAVKRCTRRLDPKERQIYLLDQRINDRGVLLDVPLVKAAKHIAAKAIDLANKEITEATKGEVTAVTQTGKLQQWLGVDSVRKSVVQEMLEGDLPSNQRRVLEARAEAGRSSVSKLNSMLDVRCVDDRLRGLLLYHGAATGRWTGRLVQPHNFPRGEVKDVQRLIPAILARDYDLLNALHAPAIVVSSALRGMLRATPGHRLIAGDFSQIEARVVNWIAGQVDVLAEFAKPNNKVYEKLAAKIYSIIEGREVPFGEIDEDDPRRQTGKTVELGCGFQMGAKTYRKQAYEQYGLTFPPVEYDDEGNVVYDICQTFIDVYRSTHERVKQFWGDANNAALQAVANPGKVFDVRGCRFSKRGGYLWLVLPSGRPLCYARPQIKDVPVPWDETGKETRPAVRIETVDGYTKKWVRRALYGGLLTENIVQALARDVMAEGMLRLEAAGYPIVLDVHDEIVADVPNAHGNVEEFHEIMTRRPAWAQDLPVAGKCWEGPRYKK